MKVYRLQRVDGLGGVLAVMLAVVGVGLFVNSLIQYAYWQGHPFVVPTDEPNATFPQPEGGIALAMGTLVPLGWIGTVVVWCIWQHHATANLWARRFGFLQIRPGWAVGWWFIPVANLFMPFLAMRELARRSNGDGGERPTPPVVVWWWVLYLGSIVIPAVASFATVPSIETRMRAAAGVRLSVDLTEVARTMSAWGIVGGVLSVAAAVMAVLLVRRVTAGQDEVVRGPMPPRPDVDLPWLPAQPG